MWGWGAYANPNDDTSDRRGARIFTCREKLESNKYMKGLYNKAVKVSPKALETLRKHCHSTEFFPEPEGYWSWSSNSKFKAWFKSDDSNWYQG